MFRHCKVSLVPVAAILLSALPAVTFARGEFWMPKPPPPPPLASLTNEARYLEWKFREDVSDSRTGLGADALREKLMRYAVSATNEPWCVVKAKCYAILCDEMAIDLSPLDWFPAISIWNRYNRPMSSVLAWRDGQIAKKFYPEILSEMRAGDRSGQWRIWKDFDHSVPVWEELLTNGLVGVRAQILDCDDGRDFYRALSITVDASLRLLDRLYAQGLRRIADGRGGSRLFRQIAALGSLRRGPPRTAYEVMLFIDLYFLMSEHLDAVQCRSLSIIDRTLWPYYRRDLADGRTTEVEFREQFRHFLWQWASIDNYWGQPITVGGTKADGTTEYNPLSRVILEVMDECYLPTPKFHAKIGASTPPDVLKKLLDMARRHRSLSFIGEEPVWRALGRFGYTAEETRGFYTKGCYEVCVPNGANSTGVGYLNLLKQVELTLAETKDAAVAARYPTYADFEGECLGRMRHVCRRCLACADAFEKHLDDVNPANVATLGVAYAIRKGKDAFANGSERGNNTGVEIAGLGTTADALAAVRELVYERRETTLGGLAAIMAENWRGHDGLRLRMRRSPHKWGNNDPVTKAIAKRIESALAAEVNGKPNARGGVYGLVGHAARAYLYLGEQTGATPDGRKAGEEFSKNLSPQPGADTEGATALVETLAALDAREWAGDFPLDMMLHPSAVSGERGLSAMKALLDVYYANGGLMMQFNVVSPEELREAQRHPERYENLQIRVCGWNVRWNDIPKVEQDAYIVRAESCAE